MSGSTTVREKSEHVAILLQTPRMNYGRNTEGESAFHSRAARDLRRDARAFKTAIEGLIGHLQVTRGEMFAFLPYTKGMKPFYEGDSTTLWEKRQRPCRYVLHIDGVCSSPAMATIEIGLAALPVPEHRKELQRLVREALKAAKPSRID